MTLAPILSRDLLFCGGLLLADYGVWLMHRPTALILGGLAVAGLAVASARSARR